jgi:glycosyltransferase involved in cell wall biosynthesis
MNPLKVYEYLAAGKPIIASGLVDFEEAGDLVFTATTPEEFAEAVRTVSSKSVRLDQAERRRQFAKEHSWDKRVWEMLTIVNCCRSEIKNGRTVA